MAGQKQAQTRGLMVGQALPVNPLEFERGNNFNSVWERAITQVQKNITPPKVFFVHIMKTAGTAVHAMLKNYYSRDELYPGPENTLPKKIFISKLLGLPDEVKSRNRYVSVHMPAWVAGEFAPDYLHVSVLREPVERTISHLRQITRAKKLDNPEEVYDSAGIRDRLSNYQTRIFSMSKALYAEDQRIWAEVVAKAGAQDEKVGSPDSAAGPKSGQHKLDLYDTRHAGLVDVRPRTEDDLLAAITMADSFDVIGVTERLDSFLAQLGDVMGISLGQVPRRNVAPDSLRIPDALRERIYNDNALDILLYKHVLGRTQS